MKRVSYAFAYHHPAGLNCGDVLVDPYFGDLLVDSVYFRDGRWQFTTTQLRKEAHESA